MYLSRKCKRLLERRVSEIGSNPVSRYSSKVLLALLSGFLLGLSFPSCELYPLAFIALAPLLLALRKTTPRVGFALAYITGFSFFTTIYQWGLIFGVHVFLALALWQGFYIGLWGASVSWFASGERLSGRTILLPALLWASYEFLKVQGMLGTNWGALAYSQYKFIPLIQIAGITGLYGISFFIVLVNTVIAEAVYLLSSGEIKIASLNLKELWSRERGFSTGTGIALILSVLILVYGYFVIIRDAALEKEYPEIPISIAQPNIDICLKWDEKMLPWTLEILKGLTRQGIDEGGKLIFWPETSIPAFLSNRMDVKIDLRRFCQTNEIYLLAGAPMIENYKILHNAVLLFTPERTSPPLAEYSKRHLVPFGEYLPFNEKLRKYSLFDRVQNFSPGSQWIVFKTPWASFSVLICFESDFQNIARTNIKNGAQFLAVVTNDAWFERSSAAMHHIGWGVLRAVENHCNIVQSANTGVSGFIDYHGRIHKKTKIYTRTQITDRITLLPAGTPYTHCGDIFAVLCILSAIIFASLELKMGRGSKGSPKARV